MERPALRRVVVHAAVGKANLGAFGTVVALAALSHQLGFVFAGLFLYTLMIARHAASPRFWRRMLAEEAEAARQLPGTAELADDSLRVVVCSLRNGYSEIDRVLRHAPPPIRAHARDAVS